MYVTVTTSDSTARPIFRNGDNATRSTSVYIFTQSGILYAVAGTCITSVPISTGVSYHIALTWSQGTLSLYVNGLLFDSSTDTLQTLTYPPSSLASATLVSGLRYTLNGYTIDASSTGSGFETRRAFDYDTSTFWLSNSSYSATTGNYFAGITTPTLLGTISGEWLEITSPTPVRVQSYSIRVRNDTSFAQSPAIWYIVAENSFDTTWQVIDVKHNVTWTQGELKTFTIQNIGFYTSYRIIVTRTNFTSGIGPVGIAEFLLFGRGLSDISAQTYYTLGGASFVGSMSQFQITSGLKYTRTFTPPGVPYMSLEYPPVALSSNVTTVSGQSYGNGVYTSGSSNGNGTEFNAFDKSYASLTWWQGSATYDADGLPTNPSSFVIDGLTVPCEWLSIQLPAPIILRSYMVRAGLYGPYPLFMRAPASWFIAGSTNGVTWTRVDEEEGVVYNYDNQEFEFSVRSTVAYSRFAILVTSKQPSGSETIMQIGEWRLFGTPGVSTQRMITYDLSAVSITQSILDGVVTSGLQAYYDFSVTQHGTLVTDLSNNGRSLTWSGTPAYVLSPPYTLNVNGALATSSAVTIDTTNGITLECLLFVTTNNNQFVGFFLYLSNNIGFTIQMTNSYLLYSYISNGTTHTGTDVNVNQVATNTWYHYVFTYTGTGTWTTYLNGVQVKTGSFTPLPANAARPINLSDGSANLNGRIGLARMYNRALTSAEVIQNYNTTVRRNTGYSLNPII
jgi:hypothetical protein